MGFRLRAALGAELGALAGATLGFFAGWGVGRAVGLPRYRLGNDPAGFDDFGSAILGLWACWLLGTVLGARLLTRGARQPRPAVEATASACFVILAMGTMVVGSAAADWYYPTVLFVAPAVAMAAIRGGAASGNL